MDSKQCFTISNLVNVFEDVLPTLAFGEDVEEDFTCAFCDRCFPSDFFPGQMHGQG